jgi:hypothetical protein
MFIKLHIFNSHAFQRCEEGDENTVFKSHSDCYSTRTHLHTIQDIETLHNIIAFATHSFLQSGGEFQSDVPTGKNVFLRIALKMYRVTKSDIMNPALCFVVLMCSFDNHAVFVYE